MRAARRIGLALAAVHALWPAEAAPVRTVPGMPRLTAPVLRPHVAPLRPAPRGVRRRSFRPFFGGRRFPPNTPPYLLAPPPPDEFVQPPGERISPLIEDQPFSQPPLPGGFILTVPVGAGQTFAVPATLNRYFDVGQALGRCSPAPEGPTWGSITLRVSFKRDGSVFGLPRIPYSDAGTAEQKSDLAHSLLAGLKRCTPLPLSRSLGAAVAGEIFAIRFIHQDKR